MYTADTTILRCLDFEPVRLIADDEDFFVPAHWHEEHDEIITVLEGKRGESMHAG